MTASRTTTAKAMGGIEDIRMAGDQVTDRFHDRRETIESLRKTDPNFRDLHDDYKKVIDMLAEATSQSERNRRDLLELREALAVEIEAYLEKSAASGRGHRPDGS